MIRLTNITKSYGDRKLFSEVTLTIEEKDFVCICGKSGSGKSTLLNILGLSDIPNSGDVEFDGCINPNFQEIQQLRKRTIGYLFQNYGLVDNLTVKENLDIASRFCLINKNEKNQIYQNALNSIGLTKDFLSRKIYSLSGGEQQRVALARLIIKQSKYIFADEPTGNLDSDNKKLVFNQLCEFNKQGATVIYVSHDQDLIRQGNKKIELPFI